MKQLTYILLTVILTAGSLAQESGEPIKVGAYTAIKSAINTSTIPTGWKTGITFQSLPDIGASGMIPLSQQVGLSALIDLGLTSTSSLSKPFVLPSDSNTLVLNATYLSFAPSLLVQYVYLGLNIGVPLSARQSSFDGSTNVASFNLAGQTTTLVNQLGTLIELRLGGYFPLIEDNSGTLSAFAVASYQLSGTFSSFPNVSDAIYTKTKTTTADNPQPASLSVGFRYLFDWTKQDR